MRMIDIIEKKRDGLRLTKAEVQYAINGYVKGEIPDYQMSALLMAIYFQGMETEEVTYLTEAMLYSGDVMDLSHIPGVKVDKHSTGGVGDKTTLILGPLAASLGVKVAKLSGRGLGHTGGTLDKLESIDGCRIDLTEKEFVDQVNRINIAVAGQTGEIVPADKMLYALRDVTGSVPSIPLIASSIMSKKLAAGADVICLDIKIGDGAFMKTIDDARRLSEVMVSIGNGFNKKVTAFLTGMEQPLGRAIGNRLEVKEAIETLSGNGPEDLTTLCVEIAAMMLKHAGIVKTLSDGKRMARENLHNGKALGKFTEFIQAQGGQIADLATFVQANEQIPFLAKKSGIVQKIKAYNIGLVSMKLGGGRETKEDIIDPMVGIVLNRKIGDRVACGETLATIYANRPVSADIIASLEEAFVITEDTPRIQPIIFEVIGA
ncbi:MAG: pyrimidine-nucleoside phosphorylase [Acholeplasmataceae bacterium]|nr:pyrimidine-nucleoside phosphorylase [Acholeplasmataceae bacterium]